MGFFVRFLSFSSFLILLSFITGSNCIRIWWFHRFSSFQSFANEIYFNTTFSIDFISRGTHNFSRYETNTKHIIWSDVKIEHDRRIHGDECIRKMIDDTDSCHSCSTVHRPRDFFFLLPSSPELRRSTYKLWKKKKLRKCNGDDIIMTLNWLECIHFPRLSLPLAFKLINISCSTWNVHNCL